MPPPLPPQIALPTGTGASLPAACPNCSGPLPRPRPKFCPDCGQETHIQPPTLGEFVQQFGGAYLSTEGALWRTLKLLFTRPGELTVRYLAGQRKHFVLPLRLYLSISVLLLLLTRVLGGVDVIPGLDRPEVTDAERGPLPTLVLNAASLSIGIRDSVFVCDGLPAWLCGQIRERAAPDARTLLSKVRRANERLVTNAGALMFVLLPAFALCLKVVNLGSGLRYTAHLVFALHLHAFWFVMLALARLVPSPLEWLAWAAMAVYTLQAGQRVYGGGWVARLARALALSLLYMALLALTVPVAWMLALLA